LIESLRYGQVPSKLGDPSMQAEHTADADDVAKLQAVQYCGQFKQPVDA
jgi:hypothetical protein